VDYTSFDSNRENGSLKVRSDLPFLDRYEVSESAACLRIGAGIPRVSGRPDENATRRMAAQWRQQGSSCLLAVPSAILPEESNFVLNPEHPDAPRLRLVRQRPFTFDPRLI